MIYSEFSWHILRQLIGGCYSAAYKLLTSAVVPRPVAFVSSLSKDGVPNLAPFR